MLERCKTPESAVKALRAALSEACERSALGHTCARIQTVCFTARQARAKLAAAHRRIRALHEFRCDYKIPATATL